MAIAGINRTYKGSLVDPTVLLIEADVAAVRACVDGLKQ